MNRDYIANDLMGFPFNSEFPPDLSKNGDRYHGYENNSQEALFYYFAVLGYDLQFSYKGTMYYFLSEENYVALCDDSFSKEFVQYENAIVMIRTFKIDGQPLLNLIDSLENADIL